MKNNRKPDRAPPRYRNDKPPRASLPSPNTHAGVMSHITGKKAFFSRKIFVDDKPCAIAGMFYTVQGVVKSYYVAGQKDSAPLFVWDKQSAQWYLNRSYGAEHHPCCPDKTATQLPDYEIRYLMKHGLMDLMEAKLNGYFTTTPWIVYDETSTSKSVQWNNIKCAGGTVVFNSNGTFRIV